MLPSTWLAVLLFLLLILPGLVFVMLADRRRVSPPQSTFREISGVTVWSLIFTALSLAIALCVHLLWHPTQWLPDIDALVRDPGQYSREHYAIVSGAVLGVVSLATLLSTIPHALYRLKNWKRRDRLIGSESAWQRAFVTDRDDPWRVYLRVKTNDGTVYHGSLIAHSPDFSNDDRELLLGHPGLSIRQPGDDKQLKELPPHWKRVILHGSAIESITVGYLIDQTPADPPTQEAPTE